ncbi:MAG TPA: hypothetical protein VJI12_03670 [archaeon]|nr:hypothetical protein [archaeon]
MLIEVFSAKWDRYVKDVDAQIRQAIEASGEDVEVHILDIGVPENEKRLENYIMQLEKKHGVKQNPVIAVPLIVVNGHPITVGISPTLEKRMIETIELYRTEEDDA